MLKVAIGGRWFRAQKRLRNQSVMRGGKENLGKF